MRASGFTLLELLVAIVVMGFVLAGLAGGARYGLRAAEVQARSSEATGTLDAVDRTLRRVIEQADPRAPLRGAEGSLGLVSALPDGAGMAEFGLGVDGRGRLMLRWTPRPSGRRLGPAAAAREATLLDGVGGITLAYWSAETSQWTGAWREAGLPGLVRLRVRFAEGDGRHWPDIVAAPMQHEAGSR